MLAKLFLRALSVGGDPILGSVIEAESIRDMASAADFNFPPLTIGKNRTMNAQPQNIDPASAAIRRSLLRDFGAEQVRQAEVSASLASSLENMPGSDTKQPVADPVADPEADVERAADLHRRGILKFTSRIAETKRDLKAKVAAKESARKALAEGIVEDKETAARKIAADTLLLRSSKAALDVLAAE